MDATKEITRLTKIKSYHVQAGKQEAKYRIGLIRKLEEKIIRLQTQLEYARNDLIAKDE